MKRIALLICTVSFLCFLLFLLVGDSVVIAVGAVPFMIFLCAAFHETGHCVGCLLTGSVITEVRLLLFAVAKRKVMLIEPVRPFSYCSFQKNRHPWLVYLLGPVFSLVCWSLFLLTYLRTAAATLLLGSIVAFGVLAVNAIPVGRNDAASVLREILHRNEP